MAGHTTHQPHGSGIRGLSNLKNIDNEHELAGKFGRMFKGRDFPPTNFPEEDLFKLGDAMTGTDGPNPKSSFLNPKFHPLATCPLNRQASAAHA